MPVRLLSSSVFRWPDAATVHEAVSRWAEKTVRDHPEVQRIGYFGSYARGSWGVGSDVDLVIVVTACPEPFEIRAAKWELNELPVPVDALIYTADEWHSLFQTEGGNRRAFEGAVWVYDCPRDVRCDA